MNNDFKANKIKLKTESVFTDSGAHAKIIHTWANYFKENHFKKIGYEESMATLESFAFLLGNQVSFPWEK